MATRITGCVFDIQRFSLQDGPGLRTLVFLKGCPLHCPWCSNPESQHVQLELLYDASRCTGCGSCVRACTRGALGNGQGGASPCFQPQLCDLCGNCVAACPSSARWICGRWMTVDEVVAAVRRDAPFYRRSGGGMTLGGGEPVLQPAFSLELLHRVKGEGMDTAVETCGYGDADSVLPLLLAADHVYFDIKHVDAERHVALTGVGNELILTNLSHLLKEHADVTVRYPLVPGYTDHAQDIQLLARLLLHLPRIPPVEIVPYHRYGEHKYQLLQRHYPLKGLTGPSLDSIQDACGTLQRHGIECDALTH